VTLLTNLSSKTNTKRILGPQGVGEILRSLHGRADNHVRAVGIGGIKLTNVGDILRGSASAIEGNKIGLEGVAIVSAIMAASDPEQASRDFLAAIKKARLDVCRASGQLAKTYPPDEQYASIAPEVLKAVKEARPISHNMTNLVCALSYSLTPRGNRLLG
jgi:thiamine-phosphate diphosphorylase/hydroxyethylthiazole kinase